MRPCLVGSLLLLPLAVSGCYSTRPNLPKHSKSIAIPVLGNKSHIEQYERGLEVEVTNGVRKVFLQNGMLQLTGRENADLILEGDVLNLRRKPLRVDRLGEPAETQLILSVNISLYDVRDSRYLFKDMIVTNESLRPESGTYNLRRGEYENLGRERAVEDLARAISRKVLDRW